MQHKSVLLVAMSLLQFSQLALGGPAVNPQSLGTVQAAVDFCTQIKPDDAAKYREQAVLLTSGLSEQELTGLRDAEDYKETYASVIASLGEIDSIDAVLACDRFLTGED